MSTKNITILFCLICLFILSCKEQFQTYPINPNLAGESGAVPPEYLLRQILSEVRAGTDQTEEPFSSVSRLNQFTTGLTFPLYGGSNLYNWTSTNDTYNWIRNLNKLEENAIRSIGKNNNTYVSLSKFLKVYSYVWLTQRVGDIPVFEAGKGLENAKPKFDSQEEIYLYALNTLDEVNKELALIASNATSIKINGDIYYAGNVPAWRRAINAYTLRILISLSKRANDTSTLQIKERFAKIMNNPGDYPLFRDITDNWNFVFLPVTNRYPTQFFRLYSLETTVSNTYLDLLKNNEDPRIFIAASPSPIAISSNKKIDDFTSYNGTDNSRGQGGLFSESNGTKGQYSYINYNRYLKGPDFIPEPYIICGYSEMCFNIAEAANRGWITNDAEKFYMEGIKSSLKFYGITQGGRLTISSGTGAILGDAVANVDKFLGNVKYSTVKEEGLKQILEQKYVAFWQNSGWEPYYQFRRTGVPAFKEGEGTNSQKKIPLKWLYPVKEIINNAENAKIAIDKQFNGNDDIFAKMWLIK